ncbi:uncharacterized protein LOC115920486 [Strongylocentrotus purpuratus]|uniref:PDZ domain-containing protein n=1 Tax=Strongylocentrotus purpuratus TaxID=7668 RepID=A0A7M7N719_STRPU|nr:uncharacterized protein LOC115920486 [Strongylocentrotus purpuratus]
MSGAEVCSGDRYESSRLFVQCQKKCPKILTDFGCSLETSGGPDGGHSVVEVDWSGLAWKAGCRNRDVIMAVNAADMKVTDVGHSSLVEYLRDNGQTCSLLIKRDQEDVTNFYWIAFHVKVKGNKDIQYVLILQ